MSKNIVREGDLYKIVTVADKSFDIRYGYTCEGERPRWEPYPMYPDFLVSPEYTAEGYPFVTGDQDICEHYNPKPNVSGENWCNDCTLFDKQEEHIGICRCEKRFRKPNGEIDAQNEGATI